MFCICGEVLLILKWPYIEIHFFQKSQITFQFILLYIVLRNFVLKWIRNRCGEIDMYIELSVSETAYLVFLPVSSYKLKQYRKR